MSALIRMMKKIEGGEAFGGEVETGKAILKFRRKA